MAGSAGSTDRGRGLVLMRGPAAASMRWLRRGPVMVAVHDLGAWTGVTLAEPAARRGSAADGPLMVLASRPVPTRRRPALGFFVLEGSAVITLQSRGSRAGQRWLFWQPGVGLRRVATLAPLPTAALVAAAGATEPTAPASLSMLLHTTVGEPVDLLVAVLDLLGLPGARLLVRPVSGEVIEPDPRLVRRFDEAAANERRGRR